MIHPIKGLIIEDGKKLNPLTNKVEVQYIDERGKPHKLDGTERDEKEVKTETENKEKENFSKFAEIEKELVGDIESKDKEVKENENKDKKHSQIMEALGKFDEFTQAIKSLPKPPEKIEVTNSQEQTKDVQKVITTASKDIRKKIGEIDTSIDLQPVLDKLDEFEKKSPQITFPQAIDYTEKLKELSSKLDFDFSPMVSAIKANKTDKIPFTFNKRGELMVYVDRTGGGGGGGGLSTLQESYLKKVSDNVGNVDEIEDKLDTLNGKVSTETKQDDIITALGAIDLKETTGMNGGPVTVGTSAVEMTFSGITQSIKIASASTNAGTIYIGKSDVTSAGLNALDELVTGQALIMELNDASEPIYAVASIAAQKVYKQALT